jgi:hypothetical protein
MKNVFQHATLAACVATALGASAPASAVNLTDNGLGEVAIVPYYTVRNGLDTYLSVVNTSPDYVVAVKIRFRESDNSRDARDFNIFLSPNDVWTAAVTMAADGETPVIQTNDTTCTAPALVEAQATMPGMKGVKMTNAAYAGGSVDYPNPDTGSTSIERAQEGYVEFIVMGVADPAKSQIADWAMHPNPECPKIVNQYIVDRNAFSDQFLEPLNVIKATGALVAVGAGASTGMPVTTLSNFFNPDGDEDPTSPATDDLMDDPDSPFPNLNSGDPIAKQISTEQGAIEDDFQQGVDAVSSLFDTDVSKDPEPFEFFFQGDTDGNGLSCVTVDFDYYDREEGNFQQSGNVDFSPKPPGVPGSSICQEVQTLSFGGAFLGSGNDYGVPLAAGFENGWMRLTFPGATKISGAKFAYGGLPVIGFGIKGLQNSAVQAGVLRNYAIVQDHAYLRELGTP